MYANSALGGLGLLRGLLMVAFACFTQPLYVTLDSNIATTVLAAASTLFCISPIILLRYGRVLRKRSPFAKYSIEMAQRNLAVSSIELGHEIGGIGDTEGGMNLTAPVSLAG